MLWSLLQEYFLTSHTAAIAAGNNGVPVRMHGFEYGRASGMAPRARYSHVHIHLQCCEISI